MKKIRPFFFVASMILLMLSSCNERKNSSNNKSLQFSEEVVIACNDTTFPMVRHILIKGSQFEIGKKLAEIAQERYQVKLAKNPTLTYGKARYDYLKINYPELLERSKGVLAAYGINFLDPQYDPTTLSYSIIENGCSMIYFPDAATENDHSMSIANFDFGPGTYSDMLGKPSWPGEPNVFQDIYLVNNVPDEGYASFYVGVVDLVNGAANGMNEHGLMITSQVDHNRPHTTTPMAGGRVIGLSCSPFMRNVLENARNCEEAKILMLTNKYYDPPNGQHMLVGDAAGNSFIFEIDQESGAEYITDGNGKPQVMTNNAVWKTPPLDSLPDHYADPYDSFNRYKILIDNCNEHKGKFSTEYIANCINGVFPPVKATAALGGPAMLVRTVWQVEYDMTDKKVRIRFWLRDKKMPDGNSQMVFSDWYHYQL